MDPYSLRCHYILFLKQYVSGNFFTTVLRLVRSGSIEDVTWKTYILLLSLLLTTCTQVGTKQETGQRVPLAVG